MANVVVSELNEGSPMDVSKRSPRETFKPVPCRSKRDLSTYGTRLIELLQRINFGRLEGLQVRNGEPILKSSPVVIREHKFGGDNGIRPELAAGDFLLKQQVVELFDYFDELQNGVIDVLEIKPGLPFRMIVKEVLA